MSFLLAKSFRKELLSIKALSASKVFFVPCRRILMCSSPLDILLNFKLIKIRKTALTLFRGKKEIKSDN